MDPATHRQIDTLLDELDLFARDLGRALDAVGGQLPATGRRERRRIKRIRRQTTHHTRALRRELRRARNRVRIEGRLLAGSEAASTGRALAGLADELAALLGELDLIGHAPSRNAEAARERAHAVAMHLNGEADLTLGRPEMPWRR